MPPPNCRHPHRLQILGPMMRLHHHHRNTAATTTTVLIPPPQTHTPPATPSNLSPLSDLSPFFLSDLLDGGGGMGGLKERGGAAEESRGSNKEKSCSSKGSANLSNPSEIMGESSAKSFCVKILVAKEENKVIMAESDKELIDVLFSFMILPIASVVSLTRNCLIGDIGCFDNLYASVENLQMKFFQDKRFRDVVLNPRSAAEIYCRNLELDLTENGLNCFYVCEDADCKVISYYNFGECSCGVDVRHKIIPSSRSFQEGFVKSTARFMITDDFKVMPVAAMADLALLNELEKYGKIEERVIKIGRDEVLKLLKCSLRSKTPLSETFLKPSTNNSSNELLSMNYGPKKGMNPSVYVKDLWKKRTNIHIKLIFNKVDNTALYAVVKEDFVNLLCTFLTYPIGCIFNQFPCLSSEGCLGNLHTSIQGIDNNLFCYKERKEILVNPKLAPGLLNNSKLIGIEEANLMLEWPALASLVSDKKRSSFQKSKYKDFEGILKEPATFLVMDNLEVKPLSPISVKLLLDKLMVPTSDIDEQEVILDEDKAMRLLAASLLTDRALTTTFSANQKNVDCMDFLRLLLWGGGKESTGFKG